MRPKQQLNKKPSKQQPKKHSQPTKQISKLQTFMKTQQKPDQSSKQCQKLAKNLTPIVTAQHYTSLNVKHLGNHSLWKRTTSQTRFNDERLTLLKPDYFHNKCVLDVGCNEGFLDIEIAMRFFPKKIYAIDIDYKLIKNARKTLYRVVRNDKGYSEAMKGEGDEKGKREESISREGMVKEVLEGSMEIESLKKEGKKQTMCEKIEQLPLFFQDRLKEDFGSDFFLPESVKADNIYTIKYEWDILQYDTILCLKVTKWIHLTFGDDGIRRLFQKIYDLLRVDGLLILQAQDWLSYKRKKNMYDLYRKNYEGIRLGPDLFETVLVDDPLKEFRFELVQKIEQAPAQKNMKPTLDYPILVFKKTSTMLYY